MDCFRGGRQGAIKTIIDPDPGGRQFGPTLDHRLRKAIGHMRAHVAEKTTVDEIAAAYGISANHLTKVVHQLGRAGWVQTVRGKGGGLRLGQPAESIRVGEVVRLCEGSAAYVECMVADLSHHCRIAPACKLSGILSGAFKVFYAELDKHTLADLVSAPNALGGLLKTEPVPLA